MIKKRDKSYYILLSFVVVLYAVCCVTPKLGLSEFFLPPFLLGCLFIATHFNTTINGKNAVLTLLILLYSIIVILYKILGISSASPAEVFQHLQFFFFILIMEQITVINDEKKIRLALFIAVLIVVLNIADNIYLSILYPELNTMRTYVDEKLLAELNIGFGWFYTMSLFFFNICFFFTMHSDGKLKIIMLICSIIASIYILAYCNKASVVVFYLMSLILQVVAYKTKKMASFAFFCSIMVIVLLLLVSVFREAIVDFVISVSPSQRLTKRLLVLVDANNVDASESTLSSRGNLYLLSIDTWLSSFESFIFGIGDHRASVNVVKTGIGQHSDFADNLARYGLVGAVLIVPIFVKSFKLLLSFFEKKYKPSLFVIIIVFICCGMTKKIFHPSVGYLLFIILPIFAEYVKIRKIKEND